MTDSELLEMAYKALMHGADLNADKDMLKRWSPLTDDGDALRLVSKLGIHLQFAMDFSVAYAGTVHAKQFTERNGSDQYAATRRAIVRAAAEIGKAMP